MLTKGASIEGYQSMSNKQLQDLFNAHFVPIPASRLTTILKLTPPSILQLGHSLRFTSMLPFGPTIIHSPIPNGRSTPWPLTTFMVRPRLVLPNPAESKTKYFPKPTTIRDEKYKCIECKSNVYKNVSMEQYLEETRLYRECEIFKIRNT